MSLLSWGKCRVFVADVSQDNPEWTELPTPVEESTQVTPTKGDKKEAKVEGGENEDVRYAKNTYVIAANIRAAKGRKRPLKDTDGLIAGTYAIAILPEDEECTGAAVENSAASVEDSFTAADGAIWAYNFDALKSPNGRNQVNWGVIKVTESGGKISKITCTTDDETFDVLTGKKESA